MVPVWFCFSIQLAVGGMVPAYYSLKIMEKARSRTSMRTLGPGTNTKQVRELLACIFILVEKKGGEKKGRKESR